MYSQTSVIHVGGGSIFPALTGGISASCAIATRSIYLAAPCLTRRCRLHVRRYNHESRSIFNRSAHRNILQVHRLIMTAPNREQHFNTFTPSCKGCAPSRTLRGCRLSWAPKAGLPFSLLCSLVAASAYRFGSLHRPRHRPCSVSFSSETFLCRWHQHAPPVYELPQPARVPVFVRWVAGQPCQALGSTEVLLVCAKICPSRPSSPR